MVAAAVMAAISLQALMRHQYQRRMKTSPAPAPSDSRNFHAVAMDAPCVSMNPIALALSTATRIVATRDAAT